MAVNQDSSKAELLAEIKHLRQRLQVGGLEGTPVSTETAKREGEAKLQAIMDNTTSVLNLKDTQGRYLMVNRRFEEVSHLEREEILGKTDYDIFPPDVARIFFSNDRRVLESGKLMEIEEVVPQCDGMHTYISVKFPLRDSHDKVYAVCGISTDITVRKKVLEALGQSEERFRILFQKAPEAVVILGAEDGHFVDSNPSAISLLGRSPGELLDLAPFHLSPERQPDGSLSRESFDAHMKNAIAGGTPVFEWVFRKGRDGELPCEVRLSSYPSGNETVVRGSFTDITERKEQQAELNRLRNLLANIIDSMPSVLIGVDKRCRVTQWNREAERLTGVDAKHARGKDLADVFPRLAGETDRVYRALCERKPQEGLKVAYIHKGETRYSDITVYPLIDDDLEGAVIRVDDISDRVRMEEHMIQSAKMSSVGVLAAGMAHEINNPLAGILQNIQVMRNRLGTTIPKNRITAEANGISMEQITSYLEGRGIPHMIEAVVESGNRASRIVENMLSFSRKSESRFVAQNLGELLDKTIELAENDYDLKRKFDFRRIGIKRHYEAEMPMVPCEGSKIQQVFFNLLKNGAQAMAEKDGGHDAFFSLAILREQGMARIEIKDNGPGMDKQEAERIFEPFYTTKEVGQGTGLGLSVSYYIITENHRGTMTVASEPGCGTNFIIHLPLTRGKP